MRQCIVWCCQSKSGIEGVQFFRITESRMPLWSPVIERDLSIIHKDSSICSLHFTSDDFHVCNGRKVLKSSAVPSQRLSPGSDNKNLQLFSRRENSYAVCVTSKTNTENIPPVKTQQNVPSTSAASLEQHPIAFVDTRYNIKIEEIELTEPTIKIEEIVLTEPVIKTEDDQSMELSIKMEEVESTEDPTIKTEKIADYGVYLEQVKTEPLEEVFLCSECGFQTSDFINFQDHRNTHKEIRTNHDQNPSKTTQIHQKSCDYATTDLPYLATHIRSQEIPNRRRTQTTTKALKCDYCEYSTGFRSHLTKHIRKHTGERPFKCSDCDYACADGSTLRKHTRTHTGEKPYKCTYCDYAGSLHSTVVAHMRQHTGERPFRCTVCDYASARRGNLSVHMRRHTGVKSFRCTVCNFATAYKTALTKHVQTHL